LRFFSFRDRTEKEAREKLKEKGIDEKTTEEAMLWLKEEGLLNDSRFARQWVEGRKERYGRIRLLRELLKKGVEGETARQAVSLLSEEEELNSALEIGRRRLASISPDDPRRREKLASFLLRRGFSWEIVEKALRFLFPSP
jgi:regulatory protein